MVLTLIPTSRKCAIKQLCFLYIEVANCGGCCGRV
jgi:hypothetical protein